MKTRELFNGLQKKLIASLEVEREMHDHPVMKGDTSEIDWIRLFNNHLPARYKAVKGIVVDYKGATSDVIDIIIHDAQYTPYLYNREGATYVPAEGVYAVFEAKQTLNSTLLKYADDKATSVRKLSRTSVPTPQIDGTSKQKALHRIIGGILTLESEYKPFFSDAFKVKARSLNLDIGCCLKSGMFELWRFGKGTEEIFEPVFTIHEGDLVLATFFMKFLRALQKIGTAPAIDYEAYIQAALDSGTV